MKKVLSPIDRMIDAAVGHVPTAERKEPRSNTKLEHEAAKAMAAGVADYLRGMYPVEWRSLSTSFKLSLTGHVYNDAAQAFKLVYPELPKAGKS